MAKINLKGMGVALVTPFKDDCSIDFNALGKLIDFQIQNSADYIVMLGTTAETPTLSDKEKKKIKEFVIQRVNRRVPLVLGLGGNNTMDLVKHRKADDFDVVCAILAAFPSFKERYQAGLWQL